MFHVEFSMIRAADGFWLDKSDMVYGKLRKTGEIYHDEKALYSLLTAHCSRRLRRQLIRLRAKLSRFFLGFARRLVGYSLGYAYTSAYTHSDTSAYTHSDTSTYTSARCRTRARTDGLGAGGKRAIL